MFCRSSTSNAVFLKSIKEQVNVGIVQHVTYTYKAKYIVYLQNRTRQVQSSLNIKGS